MGFLFIFTAVLCFSPIIKVIASSNLAKANEIFGKKLYTFVSQYEGNVICSPMSVHVVLSMATAGAAGETKNALLSTLGLKDDSEAAKGYGRYLDKLNHSLTDVALQLANNIFITDKLKLNPEFSNLMENNYKSEVQKLDFSKNIEAAAAINKWVEEEIRYKFKNLIKPDKLNSYTQLVLVNIIYFKGRWAEQFKKERTREENFHLLDGSEVKCNMMYNFGKYGYMEDNNLNAKILQMCYTDDSICMLFILPNERDGLPHVEENIYNFDFQNYKHSMVNKKFDVAIPKFKIESEINLTNILKQMGLEVMFSNSANFSRIGKGGSQLKVSEVIQKAFIDVNEEGTEAAAATGMMATMKKVRLSFRADHPFMFALVQNEKDLGVEKVNILFLGRISNPSKPVKRKNNRTRKNKRTKKNLH